jgi:hypothetical protein
VASESKAKAADARKRSPAAQVVLLLRAERPLEDGLTTTVCRLS